VSDAGGEQGDEHVEDRRSGERRRTAHEHGERLEAREVDEDLTDLLFGEPADATTRSDAGRQR
jgi:hypothetical protein